MRKALRFHFLFHIIKHLHKRKPDLIIKITFCFTNIIKVIARHAWHICPIMDCRRVVSGGKHSNYTFGLFIKRCSDSRGNVIKSLCFIASNCIYNTTDYIFDINKVLTTCGITPNLDRLASECITYEDRQFWCTYPSTSIKFRVWTVAINCGEAE